MHFHARVRHRVAVLRLGYRVVLMVGWCCRYRTSQALAEPQESWVRATAEKHWSPSPNRTLEWVVNRAHSKELILTLRAHNNTVHTIDWDSDTGVLVSGSADHDVCISDTTTGEVWAMWVTLCVFLLAHV